MCARRVLRRGDMPTVAAQHAGVHVAVAWPWPSYFDPKEKLKGIRLDISDCAARRTPPPLSEVRGLYMICTMSKHAAEAGVSDALMFDYHGPSPKRPGETSSSAGTGAYTPTPDCFLDGITRRSVIALAKARQIPVHERAIARDELTGFEECFSPVRPRK
jgi:branched-chain amino acid aminotransferase